MGEHLALTSGGWGECDHCDCKNYTGVPSEHFASVPKEAVDHPDHYGGADNPYEHIKVCEALGWDYHIGGATKYLWRAGLKEKSKEIEDLKKAVWLINRKIQVLEGKVDGKNARNSDSSPPK
jgi:hypothetical protein